jgi:hypothetical protein
VVRTTTQRQVESTRAQWEKARWHLGHQRLACEPDAQAARAQQRKQCPPWLTVQAHLVAHPKQSRPGRPRQGTPPDHTEWQIQAPVTVAEEAVARAGQRKACFLVATNVRAADQLPDQELIRTYQEQHRVERRFSFLKDPLVLASSVFVKKPTRIVALSLVMVLCLLVYRLAYRLAEHRLREQLALTGQTVPNQLKQPTDRPTLRWISQRFEGVSLVVIHPPQGPPQRDLADLEPLHQQVVALLGPFCEKLYKVDD